MDIQQILALRGPNVWANFPVLEVWVRLSPELDVPSNTFPGFNDRLMSWLPSMIEHRCGLGYRGGFFERLRTGTYLGHILEHTSLEIQSMVGPTVGFGRARESIIPGLYRVAIEYADEQLGRACVEAAIALLNAARLGTPYSIEAELRRLKAHADQVCLGPSTLAIVSAAKQRGIPAIRLNEGNLVQLGYASAQHRIWTAESDQTGAIAESIAQDKQLTRGLLRGVAVPVPEGKVVTTADEAWEAAKELGLPVVVKPREGNYGRGVSINLSTREGVLRAFDVANAERDGVLVEQCIPGLHHRVLVVGNRVVAAAKGEPDHLIGDGTHTIAELVDRGNAEPTRGDPQTHPRDRFNLDAIALELLKQQGFTPASIPPAGATVILHYNGDLTMDVTDRVHPSVAAKAVLAAKTVGLNIAGIDLVVDDIGRPLEEQRGAVLEVNASPGLLMHLRPVHGQAQPVGSAIVEEIFGTNQTGRVPIVAVSGTNGKSATVALVEACLESAGVRRGVASSDGLFVDGRALSGKDATDYESVVRLLVNPAIDTLVVEMNPRTVLTEGIAFDHCDVAVVTNFGCSDHLGYVAMDRDRMLLVERCGVDMVPPTGTAVLNADDARVLGMAEKCKGNVLLFGLDHVAEPLVRHRAAGGRTVARRNSRIVFSAGDKRVHDAEWNVALSRFEEQNLLAACGAVWALGIEPAKVVDCLRQACRAPRARRVQWSDLGGRLVAVGACRNPAAVDGLLRAIEAKTAEAKLPAMAKRIAICAEVAADWQLDDAVELGKLLGTAFDRVEVLATGNGQATRVGGGVHADVLPEAQVDAVRAAFGEAIAGAGRAVFVESSGSLQSRAQAGLSELGRGDLLFVQMSSSQSFSACANFGEDLRIQDSSSHVTDAATLTRPLAEM